MEVNFKVPKWLITVAKWLLIAVAIPILLLVIFLIWRTTLFPIYAPIARGACNNLGTPQFCREWPVWRCGTGWTGFQCFEYIECPEGEICVSPAELQ